ncbi:MAG: hypothetical protein ACD_8C00124G0035 [uncultured bacterium]|nr:MAG: hypothetical protein ACD_8C00124G0035 [uncultured bacterium]
MENCINEIYKAIKENKVTTQDSPFIHTDTHAYLARIENMQ